MLPIRYLREGSRSAELQGRDGHTRSVVDAVIAKRTEAYVRSKPTTSDAGVDTLPNIVLVLEALFSLMSWRASVVSEHAASVLHWVTTLQYCA